MADAKKAGRSKKRHVAARLWTAAKTFFGADTKSPSLKESLEARYTVGGPASHSESKKLVALIHPGAFMVLTPQRRDSEPDGDRE
jgi:hypothetical protein